MASAVASEYIGSRVKMVAYDHDPGATTAIITSPDGGTTKRVHDLKDGSYFAVLVKPTIVGGNGITLVDIIASAASTMGSETVVKTTGAIQADSLNDYVFLECNAEEVKHLGATLRYLAARITHATNTDESCVTYISLNRDFETTGMTATNIT